MTERLTKLAQCLYDGNYEQAIQYHHKQAEKPSNQYEFLLLAKAYFCGQHYAKCIDLLGPIKNKTQNPKIFFQARMLLYKARYLNGQKAQGALDSLKDALFSSKSKIKKQYAEYHLWAYQQVINIQKYCQTKRSAFVSKQSLQSQREQFYQLYNSNDDNSTVMEGMPVFLISSRWLDLWEAYSSGKTKVQGQNPGPISNFQILDHIYNSFYDNRAQKMYTNSYLFQQCRYKIVPKKCWEYLYEKYGGIQVKRFNITNIDKPNQIMTQVYLKRILIVPIKQLKQTRNVFDDHWKIVQITKKQTWRGLASKLSNSWGSNAKISEFQKQMDKVQQVSMNQVLQDCDTVGKKYIYTPNSQKKEDGSSKVKGQKCNNPQCKNQKLLKFCQCKTVKYCSLECLKLDRDRHRKKCQLELQHIKQKSVVLQNFNLSEKNYSGRKGLVGLRNLGNTCYMNSGLQCLSNTKQLTQYFMSNNFLKDINHTNPLGTKGHLACAYAELIRQIWTGNDDIVSPFQLKKMIGKFAGQFSGYGQQDSQQFISYLIDGLQQDLNLVKKKQTFDTNDEIRPDQQASLQSQRNYAKRIQAYIRDLMSGQFKSTVQCLSCKKISICFDPFLLISMPIPSPKVVYAYILLDKLSLGATKINFQITEGTTFQQLQKQIANQYKADQFIFTKVDRQTFEIKRIIQNHRTQLIKNWLKQDEYLFCYQKPAPQKNTQLFFADFLNKNQRIGFGRYIKFPKNCSQKQKIRIIQASYQRASRKSFDQTVQELSKAKIPSSEYQKMCDKYFVINMKRELNMLTFKQNPNFQLSKKDNKKSLTLYDCLSAYSQKQLLQKDNQWYCNKCKEFRPAQKQMEIYKTNKILVLAFKRFTRVRKIRTYVDFPISQLDMGPYIKSNKANKPIIYDLYGVVNHYGSLGGGHYTAYCQNYLNKRWFQFNDSRVSQVSKTQIATGDSYVLFYRLRT